MSTGSPLASSTSEYRLTISIAGPAAVINMSVGADPQRLRDCKAPSTERILEIFSTLSRHELHHDDNLVRTFEPELTAQQQQVLDLLGLPTSAYTQQK